MAVCLSNKNLIHAYGPLKKVVIMPIDKTIKIIKNTAGLKVKKVFFYLNISPKIWFRNILLCFDYYFFLTFFEFTKYF